jgi:hypothetical protein
MSQPSRHQCLIYEGAPSRHLASVAAVIREKLAQNYRCLYFNSRALVNSLKSTSRLQGSIRRSRSARRISSLSPTITIW